VYGSWTTIVRDVRSPIEMIPSAASFMRMWWTVDGATLMPSAISRRVGAYEYLVMNFAVYSQTSN
jgi:hypothetical protein